MKALNEQERSKVFFQFIVLMILTLIVSIVLIFMDYEVRGRDYNLLKLENENLRNLTNMKSTLSDSISTITAEITSIENSQDFDNQKEYIQQRIKDNFSVSDTDSANNKTYKSIYNTLFNLKVLKGTALEKNRINLELNVIKKDKEDLEKKLTALKTCMSQTGCTSCNN